MGMRKTICDFKGCEKDAEKMVTYNDGLNIKQYDVCDDHFKSIRDILKLFRDS